MNKHNRNHRKLEVEALEDRFMPSSTLTSASLIQSVPQNFQTVSSQTITLSSETVTPVRSYDWVSGLRRNHNETLVRDDER